jgi:hypothetical protein
MGSAALVCEVLSRFLSSVKTVLVPARGGEGRFRLKLHGFVWKVLPLLDVGNVGRLAGRANGCWSDNLTDSGLAERRSRRAD